MNQDKKIALQLDLNELNVVMAGLGKLPYETSFQVIDVIRGQVGPQLQEQNAGGGAMGGATVN